LVSVDDVVDCPLLLLLHFPVIKLVCV
jgi:hypothetical protein